MPTSVEYTLDNLDNIAYREIQAISKAKGIPSNQKKSSLIKAIIESQKSDPILHSVEDEVNTNVINTEEPSPKEEEKEGGHKEIATSIIRTGIEASDCLSSPDFNMIKSLHPMCSSSSSSSSIEDIWKQSYVSSPMRDNQTLDNMHDITRDETEIETPEIAISDDKLSVATPKSTKKKHIAVTPTPVKFDETMNTIHEFHEYGYANGNVLSASPMVEADEQVQVIVGSPLQQGYESSNVGNVMKLNGVPTPIGKKTTFVSPMTNHPYERYNVFWSYEEYKERCEITTPQSLKMMHENVTTPQFLENQRKERAEKERVEMLSQVTKAAEELFDDLIPPLEKNENVLPSSVVTMNSNVRSSDGVENKENFGQQAKNLIDGVGGFISKVNSNIKNLVGFPSPQGSKITFFSPESKPFAINWSSVGKSNVETSPKDCSDYSSSV